MRSVPMFPIPALTQPLVPSQPLPSGYLTVPPPKPHPPTISNFSVGVSPLPSRCFSLPGIPLPLAASPQTLPRPDTPPAPPTPHRLLTPLGRFFTISRDMAATDAKEGPLSTAHAAPWAPPSSPGHVAFTGTAHAHGRTRMLVLSNGPLATGPGGIAGTPRAGSGGAGREQGHREEG